MKSVLGEDEEERDTKSPKRSMGETPRDVGVMVRGEVMSGIAQLINLKTLR